MGNPREPFEADSIYHVYNHGNGDDLIYREVENYQFFLERFKFYIIPIANVYAYCLMPNHFHFLLRIKPENDLLEFIEEKSPKMGKKRSKPTNRSAKSDKDFADLDLEAGGRIKTKLSENEIAVLVSNQFKNFLISYSKSFNKMYGRRGSLFLDNIQRIKISDDDYFTNMVRYIHFNPVLHRFVRNGLEWKYSSIHAYYSEKRSLISRNEVFDWFGGLEPFKHFHQSIQMEEFDEIRHLMME